MAIKIDLVLSPNFEPQLIAGVRSTMAQRLNSRLAASKAKIQKLIGEMLVDAFNVTPVARALRGRSETDLPAHFGLTDKQAERMADGMAKIIANSPSIRITGNRLIEIRIEAIDKGYGEFFSIPKASYVSRPSNIEIPVMKWLLLDPTIDIGQASYSIIFSPDEVYDKSIKAISRSGRAIMIKMGFAHANEPYVLPAIVFGQAGQNFLEYVLGQEGIAREAARLTFGILNQTIWT